MKILRWSFVSVVLASAVFFACSSKDNILECDNLDCNPVISSSSDYGEDPGEPYSSSSSFYSFSSSSSYISNTPSSSSSYVSSATASSSSSQRSSSSVAASSSSSVRSSSSAAASCNFQTAWCGSIAFSDIVTASQNNATGEGPVCIFATAISMLGNEYNGNGILVNGTKISSADGGRCGKTEWNQPTCAEALANLQKADGGYYIYVASGGYQEFTTTGGTPSCTGTSGGGSVSSSSSATQQTNSSSSTVSSNNPSYPPLQQGGSGVQSGYTTRYWDACKANCSWSGKTQALGNNTRCKNCSINGTTQIAADDSNRSACDNGGNAYTCFDQAPIEIDANLSYAFAATPGGGNDCGKCYQLQFTGSCKYGGESCKSISGKTLIVMSSNIGYDVSGGQFDVMIPGGGVGAFDAFSNQLTSLGVTSLSLGAQYGGFLTDCNGDASCVQNRCNSHFANITDLKRGCDWFVSWLKVADNPEVIYKEVECPQYLIDKYKATIF